MKAETILWPLVKLMSGSVLNKHLVWLCLTKTHQQLPNLFQYCINRGGGTADYYNYNSFDHIACLLNTLHNNVDHVHHTMSTNRTEENRAQLSQSLPCIILTSSLCPFIVVFKI